MNNNDKDKRLNVLVVDDNKWDMKLIQLYLKNHNIEITTANNGFDAVDSVKKGNIDVVLMDIQMPVMDGFEATKKIREFNSSIPIVAYTALAITGDRQACLDAGFTDYISKPLYKEPLLKILSNYIK